MKEEAMLVTVTDSFPVTPNYSRRKADNFSQQMVAALINKGYSKLDLAKELEVSVSTINRIVRGSINQLGGKTFSRLMRLYCAICVATSQTSD